MQLTLTIPGLTSRETAICVWIAILATYVSRSPGVRSSTLAVLRSIFFEPFIFATICLIVGYTLSAFVILYGLGYWHFTMTPILIVWFFGVGLGALLSQQIPGARYFGHLIMSSIGLTAVVEFLTNLYTFPTPIELILVPIVGLFVASVALASRQPDRKVVVTFLNGCLAIISVTIIVYSVTEIVQNFKFVASAATAEDFLLPLALTLGYLPFIYAFKYVMVMQSMLHMIRYSMRTKPELFPLVRRSILVACGPSVARAHEFDKNFSRFLWDASSSEQVLHVIRVFNQHGAQEELAISQ